MAPEISLKKGYSGPAVDVFAVGVVLFAMLTGKMPFIKAYSADPLYKEIICNKPEAFWLKHKQLKEFFNEDSKDLIQKTLCFNPENRITIKQITQHPW